MFKNSKPLSDFFDYGKSARLNSIAYELPEQSNHLRMAFIDADLGSDFTFLRRASPTGMMMICYEGGSNIYFKDQGEPLLLNPGYAVYLAPGSYVRYTGVSGMRYRHFGMEWYDPMSAPDAVEGYVGPIPTDTESFRLAHEGLCREVVAGHDDEVVAAWIATCHQFALRLVRGMALHTPLMDLRLALGRDLSHPWTNSEMAGVLQVSEAKLRSLCLEETGSPPKQMLTRMRLKHAAELLRTTPASIQDVSRQVGYESPFAFSKAFRRMFGCSPSEAR